MVKPTAQLNRDIISFAMRDANIAQLLNIRDNDPQTTGPSLRCEFFRRHASNPSKSAYTVDFIYSVNNANLELNDDVSVMVEVTAGNPVQFQILNTRVY